jgi:hypothetical protein
MVTTPSSSTFWQKTEKTLLCSYPTFKMGTVTAGATITTNETLQGIT